MNKKFVIDLILGGFSVILALLLIEMPKDLPQKEKAKLVPESLNRGEVSLTQQIPDEKDIQVINLHPKILIGDIQGHLATYEHMSQRNIFSPDGLYAAAAAKNSLPEVSYTLLGVINDKEKTAVFKDSQGMVVSFKQGQKMLDDFVVAKIDKLSLKAKKGREIKEYKIFKLVPESLNRGVEGK